MRKTAALGGGLWFHKEAAFFSYRVGLRNSRRRRCALRDCMASPIPASNAKAPLSLSSPLGSLDEHLPRRQSSLR